MSTRVAFKKWYRNGWATPLAGLIALWTWGKHSHVESIVKNEAIPLYIREKYSLSDTGISGFSASAWDNKVRFKEIDFNTGKWDILETSRKFDMSYAISVEGNGYDFIAIGFTEFLPLRLQIKNRSYCSEVNSCVLGLDFCQNDPVKLHNFLKEEK